MSKNIKDFFENEVVRMILLIFEEYQRTLAFQKNTKLSLRRCTKEEKKMQIQHILFDLDGTLLPMNQEEFVTFYMPLLAKKYLSEGIQFDPKAFIASIWKGYEAMVKNDGSCTNREAFWKYMDELLPTDQENSEKIALDFYGNEFNQAIVVTKPNQLLIRS